jgi:hypothetical protein
MKKTIKYLFKNHARNFRQSSDSEILPELFEKLHPLKLIKNDKKTKNYRI